MLLNVLLLSVVGALGLSSQRAFGRWRQQRMAGRPPD